MIKIFTSSESTRGRLYRLLAAVVYDDLDFVNVVFVKRIPAHTWVEEFPSALCVTVDVSKGNKLEVLKHKPSHQPS